MDKITTSEQLMKEIEKDQFMIDIKKTLDEKQKNGEPIDIKECFELLMTHPILGQLKNSPLVPKQARMSDGKTIPLTEGSSINEQLTKALL